MEGAGASDEEPVAKQAAEKGLISREMPRERPSAAKAH